MITNQDIKLVKSERLTDYEDGGGRITGQEVVDGQVNNLFPDISELDRVYGRVSLRKGYVSVLTETTDTLYGVHAAITDPPADDNVNVSIFSTQSWTDERSEAKDRVESYVISGPESLYTLFGDHLTGQRMIRMYCDASAPSPEVGEVYRLSVEKQGYIPNEQYVRVQKLTSRQEQTFTEMVNNVYVDFKKDIIIFELSAALRHDFPGGTPTKQSASTAPTKIRTTQVADAARYYAARPLVMDAHIGDLSVTVDTPYAPLVPSTQSETPIVDAVAGMGKIGHVPSGAAGGLSVTASLTGGAAPSYAAARYLGMGCARQSVTVTIGAVTLTDDGGGNLAPPPGDSSGYTGAVDYSTGLVTINRDRSWSSSVTITAQPAATLTDVAHTLEIPITLSNRGYNYVPNLSPVPAPGTLTVDYRALGKWVRLTDNGKGQLTGRTGEGTGTINYATGSVIVTLGALPDVDASIVFSWGTPAHYTARNSDTDIQKGAIEYTVAAPAIKPSTVTLAWLENNVEKTATDNGLGVLSGNGSGSVDYASGKITFRPTNAPDSNSLITVEYTQQEQYNGIANDSPTGRTYAFRAGEDGITPHYPLKPGRVVVKVSLPMTRGFPPESVEWRDDGAGNLTGVGLEAGTLNYTTGLCEVTIATAISKQFWTVTSYENVASGAYRWNRPVYGWQSYPVPVGALPDPLTFNWSVVESAATDVPQIEEVTHDGVWFDLTPMVADQIVPGSIRFTWAGHTYLDRAGKVYRDVDATTNSGTESGVVEYASGKVTLTDYVTGANTLTVSSLLTVKGSWYATEIFFRTPGSPLKPSSLSVRAVTLDTGETISAVANNSGVLTADYIDGVVEVNAGIVAVRFGALVADADLTADEKAQDWYDVGQVVNGYIWRPRAVVPSTITFNCVVYTFVPLDADILGIDPVRLPQDGRVPIFRPGDVVLVHHTADTSVANPVAGAVTNLRPRVSLVIVKDSDGVALPSNRYTVDLNAGTVTWADPLDLSGYILPVVITHRIEDLALSSDVQITGDIGMVRSLTHDYAANVSYVSSCLLIGDLQARYEHFHDLATFTTWADEPTGSEAAASFNDVLYPVQVTNKGSVEERWRITFTSGSAFNVVGETYGQIATGGTINDDLAPINPQTGVPYFVLDKRGWGGGWATGNTVRFNTKGANSPLWFVRTTLAGAVEQPTDNFKIQIRGDAS